MSIDFTGITGVSDDYGVITQIADAQGNVLWSADDGMRTITLTCDYTYSAWTVWLNGDRYFTDGYCEIGGSWSTWTSPITIEVPVGTQINLWFENDDNYCTLVINGETVDEYHMDYADYKHIITGNTTIAMTTGWYGQSINYITTITEIPEGHALVTITGGGNATYCYATINGTKYTTATTLVLPVGTVVTCTAKDKDDDYSAVFLNGQIVAGRSSNATYDYSVTRDVKINLNTSPSAQYEQEIHITET